MSVEPYRAIHGLPGMTLNDVQAPPYNDASFDFKHGQAVHAFPYIDGAMHEHTGLEPHNLAFSLHFLNTLRVGAFPDLYLQWIRMLLAGGRTHKLVHPLLGPRDVKVLDGSVRLQASATAGVIVDVKFTTTLRDPTKADGVAEVKVDIATVAAAADAALAAVAIPFPTQKSAT